MNNSKLVLDTHILIWYLEGIELTDEQIQTIEEARKEKNLYLSAISIWEIGMLASKGKLAFSVNVKEWVNKVLAATKISIIELSTDILLDSTILPAYENKDPADRIIIASVRSINAYLMTVDARIIAYGDNGYIKLVESK